MKRRAFIEAAVFSGVLWRPMSTLANRNFLLDGTSRVSVNEKPRQRGSSDEQAFINPGTIIKVIGVGGVGASAVDRMIERGVRGVEFLVADTDTLALKRSLAKRRIQLGHPGFTTDAEPDKGRSAAMEAKERLVNVLKNAHMVFIVAGMGGGTGSGAAPIIAKMALELGQFPVAAVTTPFKSESHRMMIAESGIAELQKHIDSPIVLSNETVSEWLGRNGSVVTASQATNSLMSDAVSGIADSINYPGLVCLDFEDIRSVMALKGLAKTSSAYSTGPDRARIAAEQAITSAFRIGGSQTDLAPGMIVSIRATRGLKMREINEVMSITRTIADEDALITFSAAYDESMGQTMSVTVVTTGHDG